jgi:hypothetical protein
VSRTWARITDRTAAPFHLTDPQTPIVAPSIWRVQVGCQAGRPAAAATSTRGNDPSRNPEARGDRFVLDFVPCRVARRLPAPGSSVVRISVIDSDRRVVGSWGGIGPLPEVPPPGSRADAARAGRGHTSRRDLLLMKSPDRLTS